ncbi:MAG TPA: tRNA lysidine(34) synthetase TilS [Rhodocyclaceae bacterium]|nr:tRNA lysidine(34) synthetase TilS [Rhodocyclaceae bacterium]
MASSRNKLSIDVAAFARRLLGNVLAHTPMVAGRSVRVCVGYSGGLDSTVLLVSLYRALKDSDSQVKLSAVHVHHGLSPNADVWAEHCRRVCQDLGVTYSCAHVEVKLQAGDGLEAAARRARYQVYAAIDADLIVLGQHQDDQAETVFLNLLRGTSVLGAASMPAQRQRFVRPMLDVSRTQLYTYADALGLNWIDDESNDSTEFSRNYLRKEVLPCLNIRFPSASANLARAARNFSEAQALMDDLALIDGADQAPLRLESLKHLTEARALNVLAYHLRRFDVRIASRRWLEEVLRQLRDAGPDRQIRIRADGKLIRRYQGALVIEVPEGETPRVVTWIPLSGSVAWGNAFIVATQTRGEGLSAARLGKTLEFRRREGSDKLELRAGLRRPLKDLMREVGIPPWRRHQLPVLVSDRELVWVPFVGIAEKYRCGPEEDGISLEFDEASW